MHEIIREEREIDALLGKCSDSEDEGASKYPGMTFEQGVIAGINWITDKDAQNPLED